MPNYRFPCKIRVLLILWATVLPCYVQAHQFQGGTGEPGNPYQISTADQLIRIGSDLDLMDKSFVLIEDIDLDPNGSGGRVFEEAIIAHRIESEPLMQPHPLKRPVHGGGVTAVFQGTFQGNGHVIRNMVIDAPKGRVTGLFGYVGPDARICDLRIDNARVTGDKHIGILAGMNFGSVLHCRVSGIVIGDNRVGGLIGSNKGDVTCCQSEASVTGKEMVGGLVGHMLMHTTLIDCRASGYVRGERHVGGAIGQMLRGRVIGCSVSGKVHSETNAGGLIGAGPYFGDVVRCTSTAKVRGALVGGLIGTMQCTNILHCYASGSLRQIKPEPDTPSILAGKGGLVGHWKSGHSYIASSCWDTDISGTDKLVGLSTSRETLRLTQTAGATTQQMKASRGPASHLTDLKAIP